ncbi:MAG: nucleotidyltransferase family protein [Hyphomonas sp.]
MISVPHTAIVLAAGLGTRMRPLTDDCPKPLVEVRGKPLMDYTLDSLVSAGVERAIVNVHYLADQVEAHLKKRTDIQIVISDERGEVLETGGAIAKVRDQLGNDPVLVCNTDAFWGEDTGAPIEQMAARFDPEEADVLLLLADTQRSLGYHGAGDLLMMDTGQITLRGEAQSAPWAFSGVRIIKPQLYDNVPVRKFSAKEIWKPLFNARRMYGLALDDFWLHVGDPKAVKDAEMWLMCHGR